MIFGLINKRKPTAPTPAETVYDAIVAQSRRPFLYRDLGVPDTLPGRFEAIVLHVALYMRRLRGDAGEADAFAQVVFDAMVRALEANLREIGVGDISVPKRMKAMTRSFYDGAKTYDAALDARDDHALEAALARIVYRGAAYDPGAPARLAAYVRGSVDALAAQPTAELTSRGPVFPGAEGRA